MNRVFKGFVPTKNKKCLMPFKDKSRDELLTYQQVKALPEWAGILRADIILIDVDDKKQSGILFDLVQEKNLKCKVVQSTRGKHFFFKNSAIQKCYTHCTLACGIIADIKVGKKASYAVGKYNNVEREILYDVDEYEEVPIFLHPTNVAVDFVNMEEGSGRNNKLFSFILPLQKMKMTRDQIKEQITFINFHVLPEPLEQAELDMILRDESFKKEEEIRNASDEFFDDKTFLFDKFARHLCEKHNIIKISNQLHIFDGRIYKSDTLAIEQKMIEVIPKLSQTQRNEVLSYMNVLIGDNTEPSDPRYICFRNGVYDLVTDELLDFDSSFVLTNQINFDYDKNAYSELCDKTLNQYACGDKNIRLLLEEVIGYTFYRRNELRKSFILIGKRANGKSTYLTLIRHLLGDSNISSLDLKEIGDRFRTAAVFGKLANIGDDISADYLPDLSTFRKVVSGDRIVVERKGTHPFEFDSFCKFLFSANELPRTRDTTGSNINRFIIVPFNASFTPDDPNYNPFIKYELLKDDVMAYIIQLGIAGLKRVLINNRFTTNDAIEREREEYDKINNPILSFFDEFNSFENNTVDHCYDKYLAFCAKDNYTAMTKISFSKSIRAEFGLQSVVRNINGKSERVFVK